MGAFALVAALIGLVVLFVNWARRDTDWHGFFQKGRTMEEIAADARANQVGEMDYYEFCRKYRAGGKEKDDKIIQWLCREEGMKWNREFSDQFGSWALSTELLLMAIYAMQGKVYYRVINGIYLKPKATNYNIYKDFLLWYNDELKAHGIEGMYFLYRHSCLRPKVGGGGVEEDIFQRMDKHFHNAIIWQADNAPDNASDATVFWPSCAEHTFVDSGRACDLY